MLCGGVWCHAGEKVTTECFYCSGSGDIGSIIVVWKIFLTAYDIALKKMQRTCPTADSPTTKESGLKIAVARKGSVHEQKKSITIPIQARMILVVQASKTCYVGSYGNG